MRLGRKIATILCVSIVVLPLGFVRAHNYYARWQAKRLLKALRGMQPGVTSEAEYMAALKPFTWQVSPLSEGDSSAIGVVKGSAAVSSTPLCDLSDSFCMQLEEKFIPLIMLLEGRVTACDTDFFVRPTFDNGTLIEITFKELQIHPMHCCVVGVTRHAGIWKGRGYSPEPFTGYSVAYADSSVWNSSVDVDQRATAVQLEKALDFKFDCFTRLRACEEAKDFRDPMPSP